MLSNPHSDHKENSYRIWVYTIGNEKGIKTFNYKKSTKHKKIKHSNTGNEGQKKSEAQRKNGKMTEVSHSSVITLNANWLSFPIKRQWLAVWI